MKAYEEVVIKLNFKNKLKAIKLSLEKEDKINELMTKIEAGGLVQFGPIAFWASDFDSMERIK